MILFYSFINPLGMIANSFSRLCLLQKSENAFLKAWKLLPGNNGHPTTLPNLIDERFPLNRPNWNFDQEQGREHLQVYHQTLMAGLHAAVRKLTNMTKVNAIWQESSESPAAFLERLYEAFRPGVLRLFK